MNEVLNDISLITYGKRVVNYYKDKIRELEHKISSLQIELGKSNSYIQELLYMLNKDKSEFYRQQLRLINMQQQEKLRIKNKEITSLKLIINRLLVRYEGSSNK